jgi:hypothetical protein
MEFLMMRASFVKLLQRLIVNKMKVMSLKMDWKSIKKLQ